MALAVIAIISAGAVTVAADGLIEKVPVGAPTFPPSADDGIALPVPEAGGDANAPSYPAAPPIASLPANAVTVGPIEGTRAETKAAIISYLVKQRERLGALALLNPKADAVAAVTLRAGLSEKEIGELSKSVDVGYTEWIVPNTAIHGGGPFTEMSVVLSEYPTARIVYLVAAAPLEALADLQRDDRVWLADVGGLPADLLAKDDLVFDSLPSFYDRAYEAGLLSE